jgi:hypothetical protein
MRSQSASRWASSVDVQRRIASWTPALAKVDLGLSAIYRWY